MIPRCDRAGQVVREGERDVQVMHNGLKVIADGNYGQFITQMLRQTRGVHEPQEEVAFAQVLEHLPENAVMLEVGCYWAFYSMWAKSHLPHARLHLVEPIAARREIGEANLALNQMHATVLPCAIGSSDAFDADFTTGNETQQLDIRSIDSVMDELKLEKLHLLHMDIQGFENQALLGAEQTLSVSAIDWLFISTHRHLEDGAHIDLHEFCREILQKHKYRIVADHTPEESFSVDGLIVAKSKTTSGPDRISVDVLTPALRQGIAERTRLFEGF